MDCLPRLVVGMMSARRDFGINCFSAGEDMRKPLPPPRNSPTTAGELIRIAASQLNPPRVFSLIIYLSLLGLATFWVVVWLQRRFVFWYKESVDEGLPQ